MPSAHQCEIEFLKLCIRYDDTEERHRLEKRITEIQRDARILRRAVWVMALLAALAMSGLGYAAIFMAEYPLSFSQWTTRIVVRVLCVLGAGSLLSLFGFLGFGAILRNELDRRREDCRKLALKVLESRLGQPRDTLPPAMAGIRETSASDIGTLQPSQSRESTVSDQPAALLIPEPKAE